MKFTETVVLTAAVAILVILTAPIAASSINDLFNGVATKVAVSTAAAFGQQ